jgi:hypothetical protein
LLAHSEVSGGCCMHPHSDSKPLGAAEPLGQQCGDDSPCKPCPGDVPTGCAEGTCVFAAPDSNGPSSHDQLGGDASCQGVAVIEPAISFCVSLAAASRESGALPSLAGLRLHLVHCVLTL